MNWFFLIVFVLSIICIFYLYGQLCKAKGELKGRCLPRKVKRAPQNQEEASR